MGICIYDEQNMFSCPCCNHQCHFETSQVMKINVKAKQTELLVTFLLWLESSTAHSELQDSFRKISKLHIHRK